MQSKSIELLQHVKGNLAITQRQLTAIIRVEGPSEALCGTYLSLANASNRINAILAQVTK